MEWIPRSDNEVADYLSKIVDFDDWGELNEIIFNTFEVLLWKWRNQQHKLI